MSHCLIVSRYENRVYDAYINLTTRDAIIESYKHFDIILEKDEYDIVHVYEMAA